MFAHVTTRLEGRKYENLLSEKGFGGFPSLAALDADGDTIAKLSGNRDVAGFRAMMAEGAKLMEIRAKAEKTLEDQVFLLEKDMALGNLELAEAKERVAAVEGLTDEQKAKFGGMLTDLEIKEAMGSPTSREEAEAFAKAAGPKFVEMLEAGREPSGEDDGTYQPFFILILNVAEERGDAGLFERALGKLKAKYGDNPRAARFFEAQDERLEKLKAGADESDESGEESGDDDGDDGGDGGE